MGGALFWALSVAAPARSQTANQETAISVIPTEGPLLRVVTLKPGQDRPQEENRRAQAGAERPAAPSASTLKPQSQPVSLQTQTMRELMQERESLNAARKAENLRRQAASRLAVSSAQAEAEVIRVQAEARQEAAEPPPATPAPQTPVGREQIGPALPSQTSKPEPNAEVPAKAQAAVPPDQISAERSEMLAKLNGQPAIDLSSIVKDLSDTDAPFMAEELRIDEAVAFALKNNFEVAASRQKSIGSRWEETGAVGQFLPKAELTRGVGKQRSQPAGFNDQNNIRIKDSKHHYRERIWTASQPVVDLTLITDLLSRHNTASSADAEEQSTRERIAMETLQAYYELIQSSLTLQFAESYKSQLEMLTERMQARVEGGGASQAELDRVRSRALSAQSAILDSLQSFESSMLKLRRLSGVTPQKIAIPAYFLPFVPADVGEIIKKSVTGNPDYLVAMYRSNAAAFDSATAFGRSLPKMTFQVTSTRTYNSAGSSFDVYATDGGPFAFQNEKKAMMVFSWAFTPFVDLPQTMAGVAKAREEHYKTIDIRKKIEEGVRMSYSGMKSATARVDAIRQSMESSVKVVEAFEAQYQTANRTILDLLDAYERLYQTRTELVRIVVAEARAGYTLRRQMGELVQALTVVEDRDPETVLPSKDGNK